MNWLKRIFWPDVPQVIDYPKSVLSDVHLTLIDFIDSMLVERHIHTATVSDMRVCRCSIPIIDQGRSLDRLQKMLYMQVQVGGMYIPRSVAFYVESDGTWVFLYAVRGSTGSDDITKSMFIELLTRTNNAR